MFSIYQKFMDRVTFCQEQRENFLNFCNASTEGQAPFTSCLPQVESMKIDFLALLAVEYSADAR